MLVLVIYLFFIIALVDFGSFENKCSSPFMMK